MTNNVLILFYNNFRLHDNEALFRATEHCKETNQTLIPLFIFDEKLLGNNIPGAAATWRLAQSLEKFNTSLSQYDSRLIQRNGNTKDILQEFVTKEDVSHIFIQKSYEPYFKKLVKMIDNLDVEIVYTSGQTIFELEGIKNGSGDFFKVYTPFSNHCFSRVQEIAPVQPKPRNLYPPQNIYTIHSDVLFKKYTQKNQNVDTVPDTNKKEFWQHKLDFWQTGEEAGRKTFKAYLTSKVLTYKEKRDFPAEKGTSTLSHFFHPGELSVKEVFLECETLRKETTNPTEKENILTFQKELLWREFSYYLLYHFPALKERAFSEKYDHITWKDPRNPDNKKLLEAWQKGQTGYPLVDAGMRELWQSGYMHNRVRMVVASFLIKDLGFDWRLGETWFWDTLIDADLAANAASWQWVAGSGADAAPYFRVFNPILQSEKFDPEGLYIKKWCPELAHLPTKYIHSPQSADVFTLSAAGIVIGETYPEKIVEHKEARQETLERYSVVKSVRQL